MLGFGVRLHRYEEMHRITLRHYYYQHRGMKTCFSNYPSQYLNRIGGSKPMKLLINSQDLNRNVGASPWGIQRRFLSSSSGGGDVAGKGDKWIKQKVIVDPMRRNIGREIKENKTETLPQQTKVKVVRSEFRIAPHRPPNSGRKNNAKANHQKDKGATGGKDGKNKNNKNEKKSATKSSETKPFVHPFRLNSLNKVSESKVSESKISESKFSENKVSENNRAAITSAITNGDSSIQDELKVAAPSFDNFLDSLNTDEVEVITEKPMTVPFRPVLVSDNSTQQRNRSLHDNDNIVVGMGQQQDKSMDSEDFSLQKDDIIVKNQKDMNKNDHKKRKNHEASPVIPPTVEDITVIPDETGEELFTTTIRDSDRKKHGKIPKTKIMGENDNDNSIKPKEKGYKKMDRHKFSNYGDEERRSGRNPFKMKKEKKKKKGPVVNKDIVVKLPSTLTVRELALRSGIKSIFLIQKLLEIGGIQQSGETHSGVTMTSAISPYMLSQLRLESSGTNKKKRRVARHQVSDAAGNVNLSNEVAELLMLEFGLETEREVERVKDEVRTDLEKVLKEGGKKAENLQPRPPIITVMGHVDHGKTTLLDCLRNTSVAEGEAGGITQAVAAFTYSISNDDKTITFLDTPGHEAFTSMRKCGSLLTDMVILVVAATDGVRPQTIESIELARAAGVPLIVALTKVDMPGIDKEDSLIRISTELAEHDIITESLGGSVQIIPIAAPKNIGLDNLADAINLQALELNLLSDYKSRGEAIVLESSVDRHKGAITDAVNRWGTLKVGDFIVCGEQFSRIKQLLDTVTGKPLKSVGPSSPVRIFGLSDPPTPGSDILVVPSIKRAKEVAELRKTRRLETEKDAELRLLGEKSASTVFAEPKGKQKRKTRLQRQKEKLAEEERVRLEEEAKPELITVPIIVKADTDGSLEALKYTIDAIGMELEEKNKEMLEEDEDEDDDDEDDDDVYQSALTVVRKGVGAVTSTDIDIAKTFKADIYAFNVRVPPKEARHAKDAGVKIISQSVIYHLLDDLRTSIDSTLPKQKEVNVLGTAKVLQVFNMQPRNRREGTWVVAGCSVESGVISKSSRLRVLRDGQVIHKSGLDSLKRFKENVSKVEKGKECGISLSSFQDFKQGDIIEAYEQV